MKDGTAVEVTAYIGVKGDADLNNEVDAVDASVVLTYYSTVQTNGGDKSIKFSKDDERLEGLAAFLADCDANEFDEREFHREKIDRTIDALDASYILMFYSIKQTTDTQPYDIWMQIVPDRLIQK